MMMLTLMACLGLAAGEKAVGNWHIVPLPRDMQEVGEAPFAIDSKVTVHYPEGDERQQRNAELLAGYVKELTPVSEADRYGWPCGRCRRATRLTASR